MLFIIGLLFLIIGLLWILFAPGTREVPKSFSDQAYTVPSRKQYGVIPMILGLALVFTSCFTIVGAHNVGVPTTFGKPTGDTYKSGLHFKAPMTNVTDIDATVQPEEYLGDRCIYVKIADAGSACISLAYRWRINPDGADTVYADYRKAEDGITEGVRKALVSTNIKAAINEEFGAYDPLEGVTITDNMTPEQVANLKIKLPAIETFNDAIKRNVESKIADLGDLIEIQSVTVSYIKLPDATQDRINQINAKAVDTKLALQDIGIKAAQASANVALAKSLQDPNVLVSKCLDGMISGEIKAPAGFQCWSGQNGALVLPASK